MSETADGHARLGDLRPLTRDLGQLVRGLAEPVLVLQGLAYPHVHDNLFESGQAVPILAAEFGRQAGLDFFRVFFL